MSTVFGYDKSSPLEIGKSVTDDVADVFADAARAIPASDASERAYVNQLFERARKGELDVYTLSARCRTVGVICFRFLDGDSELVFGHVMASAGDVEGYFMEKVADGLFCDGAHTVRSNFTWPEPDGFIKAAQAMGFVRVERMSMGRSPSPVERPAGRFGLLQWRDDYAPEVCRIMCESPAAADRPVYPLFSRPEGARMFMHSVLNGQHGRLLRDLSCVARDGEKTIGFLLSTILSDGNVLILNIAVDEKYRHAGVGGAMLDRLIAESYRQGYGQILLAVTAKNYDAIRLYERKGFKVNGYFRQYVLSKIK